MDITQIVNEIKIHIEKEGSGYSAWYVGIASNPKKRLFEEHTVSRNSWWICREAADAAQARKIEIYFIERLKTDGGTGGGDESSKFVYAYRKSSRTVE